MEPEADPIEAQQQKNQTKTNKNSKSSQIIDETPESQLPKSSTVINETPISQMLPTTTECKSVIETPTTNESTPTPQVPHPTMELTIKDFPSLPNQNQEKHTT